MDWPTISYVVALFTLALSNSAVTLYAWLQRHVWGGYAFFAMAVAFTAWIWCSALSAVAPSVEVGRFFGNDLRFAMVILVSPLYALFVLGYSGYGTLAVVERPWPLFLVPAVAIALLWTGEDHRLFLYGVEYERVGSLILRTSWSRGPVYWVQLAYSYALVTAAFALLAKRFLEARAPYRQQALLMLVGSLALFAATVPPTFQLVEPWLDTTALGSSITLLCFGAALARYRLLDLMPLGREAVVERMEDPVLVIDPHGRVIDLNPAMVRALAQARGRSLARSALLGSPVEEVAEAWPELARCLASDAEEVSLPLDGDLRRQFDLAVSELPGSGARSGRLVILRDTTRRREIETAIRRRTAELEEVNRDLDTFARSAAHDLKSPLVTLNGFLELLRRDALAGDLEALDLKVATLRDAVAKMAGLIDALLLLARVRQSEVDRVAIDMQRVVEASRERLGPAIEAERAEVVVPADWPVVLGHADWVEQVWVNYLSNALKYGGEPPRIELGWDPAGDAVRFWVLDNGAGLAVADRARLFEPFVRLARRSGQGRPAEGHGLGLSIVRRIVEKLGGEVGVEGAPGGGSRFYFTLPVASSKETGAAALAARPAGGGL